MNREAVLVTGGCGYIGSHAVLALLDSHYCPVVLDNLTTGSIDSNFEDVPFYKGDVSDGRLVERIVERHNISAALHFAGSIIVPESVKDPIKYYENNTLSSLAFFKVAMKAGIQKFVFSSTAAVYGACETGVASEDDPLRPISPYGWSKLFTEQMLRDICSSHPNISATVLRYFNVAGADPHGRAGQRNENATHLVRMAIDVVTGKRDVLAIYGSDYPTRDGTCERDFIHVSDLANAHLLALQGMEQNGGYKIFNCGYGRGASVLEVVETLEKIVGKRIPVEQRARRPGDAAKVISDPSRLRTELCWRPEHEGLDEIIGSALSWQKHLMANA